MQLIANGPDIPTAALHSQEEERLVREFDAEAYDRVPGMFELDNFVWTMRSPVSGDLLRSPAALSIPAQSPFSVIFSWSPSVRAR
jgi:hypothetical protein